MGEVYAGVDETLKRRVALKAVRAEHRLDTRAQARFLREAQILSQLDHPNICRVYSYVEARGQDWLVLELIEGRNLRAALDAGLTPAQRMAIAVQVAQVLVVTHAAGVAHRDLKPGNVMVTPAGEVKVLDFGLARSFPVTTGGGHRAQDDDDLERAPAAPAAPDETRMPAADAWVTQQATLHVHTQRGALLGTLAYMSPEQARGETATTASDLYSLGLLLQELFTGIAPARADDDSATLLDRARHAMVTPPSGIDPDLARLIQRLKSLAPSERPTAVDTVERLRWIATKRTRRLRRLAVAAAIAVAVLGAAKYFVDLARERTVAIAARQEADRRRGQAEALIGFMLGDLRTKLASVGRLDILDDVGSKAMGYFAAVPESALTDGELADRSAALYQIGDVRIAQGRMAEAVQPLTQSLALAQMLADRHPGDGKRLFDLAQSRFWVGFVEWRQRRLDEALVHFREYLRIATRLVALDGRNADWRLELASANSNIGSVLEEQGDLDGALDRFRAAQAIENGLLGERPDDTVLQRAAASSNNTIGAVLRALGRLDESLAHHRAELAIQEDLVRRHPESAGWRQYLSVSHNRVAMLLEARGEMREAAAHSREALAVIERLAAEDSANIDWQRELARSHYRAGVIADGRGSRAEALSHLQQAVSIMQRAADVDALNPARQRDLADARAALAGHFLSAGRLDEALAEGRTAQLLAERLRARANDDRQAARLQGLALVVEGHAWMRRGDRARATAAWEGARAALEPVARTSRDYAILDPWALALLGLGRLAEAQNVVKQLSAMGYAEPSFVQAITRGGLAMPPRPER
jgi:eukaryotic-like serine/threonine-protein kinase